MTIPSRPVTDSPAMTHHKSEAKELTTIPAIDIPDPLPPAITMHSTVIEFLIDQDLDEYGDTSLVARTWYWILHGGSPGPMTRLS
jgi:hypothetical protein